MNNLVFQLYIIDTLANIVLTLTVLVSLAAIIWLFKTDKPWESKGLKSLMSLAVIMVIVNASIPEKSIIAQIWVLSRADTVKNEPAILKKSSNTPLFKENKQGGV